VKRKMTAILAADIVSFSRLIAEDEEETLGRLTAYRSVFDDFVLRHNGRVFNTAGDSVMREFAIPVEAVRAAIDIRESLRSRNLAYPPGRWLQFRIGISVGDVVERNGDLLGMAVNVAARLENLAKPGGICISRAVHETIGSRLSVPFVDLGERQVKNIPVPIHAFAVAWPGAEAYQQSGATALRSRKPLLWLAAVGAVALLTVGAAFMSPRLAAPMEKPQDSAVSLSPTQQAAQALYRSTNPVDSFSRLVQRGGMFEDPKSAPGLYYTALLFEAKGETVGAHPAYYTLARMGLDFVDAHLRYAALVRTNEGRIVAREVYGELQEDAPSRATALVHALQLEGPERREKIEALIAAHPDFAPAYYFLAEEHSEDRMGRLQTIEDRQVEFSALAEFLEADREGRLASFFLDHSMAAGWLDKARRRYAKLQTVL
jgi:class 3 adenylate cyclase